VSLAQQNFRRINLVQGDFKVSADPDVIFTTLLGSCVAACIRDPEVGVGGMNHFLLPGVEVASNATQAESFAVHLMELLLNGLMRQGAHRDRLEAKVFGGARMMKGLSDIGKKNTEFAKRFLKYEGIRLLGGDTGGEQGRRIQYCPVSGRAMQSYISIAATPPVVVPSLEKIRAGDVDLF
jgi:chemotaxis protein CheD